MAEDLEFICKGFHTREPLDTIPQLVIEITAVNRGEKNIFLPHLVFNAKLLAIPSKNWGSSYQEQGQIEELTGLTLFVEKNMERPFELNIPINSQRLERMFNIRFSGSLVGFDISVQGIAFPCSSNITTSNEIVLRWPQQIYKKVMYRLPEDKIDRIIITSEQFNNIVENLKHFELLRFEIPIKEPKNVSQKDLNGAIKLLFKAKEYLIQGDYKEAMLEIRNSLFNYILQDNPNSTQKPPEKILKPEIKEYIVNLLPSETQQSYTDIVDHLDQILKRIRHILSKFIHESSDKLKMAPLRQDVELCYFLTIFVLRRLTSETN